VTKSSPIDTTVPHSARVWNYWLGGKDNYQVDRDAGDDFAAKCPEIFPLAKQSRQFLVRAVSHLVTDAGVRQFLDIGTGLPTMDNTHQVAQRAAPDCRIVYVDNDPLVLAHARALLVNTTPEGVTAYVEADLHDPELIVADTRNILNFNQPIGVMFMGVLGHIADFEESLDIVARVMAATPSGSYLTLWEGTDTSESLVRANAEYAETGGVPYIPRSLEQLERYFEGLEVVDPGLVPVTQWRPEVAGIDAAAKTVPGYGAVARKP
jgi:ubiquinone/menaquinone biosynthesis C-methylase UbiE